MSDPNKQKDMMLLAEAFFNNLERDNCEYGGIGVDSKRPFGNSYVEGDILEIFGHAPEGNEDGHPTWSREQEEYAAECYSDLLTFLPDLFARLTADLARVTQERDELQLFMWDVVAVDSEDPLRHRYGDGEVASFYKKAAAAIRELRCKP